jgi:inner membrane protein
LGAGEFVERRVKEKLARQEVSYSQFISSPAPFTTLLWRVVGIDKRPLFRNLLLIIRSKCTIWLLDFYPRNLALMAGIEEHPPVAKLKWFTRGYYAFSTADAHVVMTDLRMGSEPDYVFRFKVARLNDQHANPLAMKG